MERPKTASRSIDELGRIIIPADIRNALGWGTDTKLAAAINDITIKSIVVQEISPVSICQGVKWNSRNINKVLPSAPLP